MSWAIGYDSHWQRDIGYGVPSWCDHPGCTEKIDRGLGYVCGGDVYGGEKGCGLFFCGRHAFMPFSRCTRCKHYKKPYPAKPDHPEWVKWKLTDTSWQQWREEHSDEVLKLQASLKAHP